MEPMEPLMELVAPLGSPTMELPLELSALELEDLALVAPMNVELDLVSVKPPS